MIKVVNASNIVKRILFLAILISFIFVLFKNYHFIKASNRNKNNVYKILVDVEDSKLYLFENDTVIKEYKCSGGKTTTPSPIGTWRITHKAKWGEGFGRKFYGVRCPMGSVWNTWNA